MSNQTVIIGAGISGLVVALRLAQQSQSFKVLESRSRIGGRIKSVAGFDLGPSWFWPGQANVEGLVRELGLSERVVNQYSKGEGVYERADGSVVRGVGGFSMGGSYRLQGGLAYLTKAIEEEINRLYGQDWLHLNSSVTQITAVDDSIELRVSAPQQSYSGQRVVLALPPRVALASIDFSPALTEDRTISLNQIETWMAGHAKAVFEYPEPFWRHHGLSGDAISERGPLREIHDASLDDQTRYGLFGFFGLEPPVRKNLDGEAKQAQLQSACLAQLSRLFGEQAAQPSQVYLQDWSRQWQTATELDQRIQSHHPLNQWSDKTEASFDHRLIWSSSEAATGQTNGYIEGAVVAAEATVSQLVR